MNPRLDKLVASLPAAGVDALFVTNPLNIHYLVGFGEDSYLLVSAKESVLLTDFRYVEEAESKVKGARIHRYGDDLYADVRSIADSLGANKLGFESAHMTHSALTKLAAKFDCDRAVPTEGLVEKLRLIKDDSEIAAIARAASVADAALTDIFHLIRPGVTEMELATELKYRMSCHGAQDPSFKPIIAFDANASLPHAKPGDRVLAHNAMVQFDWGAKVDHYCSDCSRVFFVGNVPPVIEEIYAIVMEANNRAKALLKPGVSLRDVDTAARSYITERGYGDKFGHGLGHGVGLAVHESPRLNPRTEDIAANGMIVTIEAGIYLPGIGGIRVEDLIAVTGDGIQILTSLDRGPRNHQA